MKCKVMKRFSFLYLTYALLFTGDMSRCIPSVIAHAFPVATSADVSISSGAGIVLDFDSGAVLYEQNADVLMVPASLTKMMQAYIVYEEIASGNLGFDTMIQVSPLTAAMSNDLSYPQAVPLVSGSYLSVDTLLQLILIPSASASCIVLAEHISGSEAAFVQRMNETAERMGIEANYENCHGASVHYVTARSQAVLVQNFIKEYPDILRYTQLGSMTFDGKTYNNTNRFLSISPYPNVDGFKSGNIAESGFCLAATMDRDGHRLISVTFKATSRESLYTDNIAILENSYSLLKNYSPIYEGIGTHAFRSEIEQFYNSGFSPYEMGATFEADAPMGANELYDILKYICSAYNLTFEPFSTTGEILTKGTTAKLIYDVIPFLPVNTIAFADRTTMDTTLQTAVDSMVSTGILEGMADVNFNAGATFTKGDVAIAINHLLAYIENNINWLPRSEHTYDTVVLDTPMTVNIPFIFNTHNRAFSHNEPILTHQARSVQLLEVNGGNWWKVEIDGSIQWLYTQGNMTYCKAYTPVYNTPNDTSEIRELLDAQIVDVLGYENGYMKITTQNGVGFIKGNLLNYTFMLRDNFSLTHQTNDNTSYTTSHSAQTVNVMDIGENGLWYITVNGQEGWYDSKKAYTFADNQMQLLNTPTTSVTTSVTTPVTTSEKNTSTFFASVIR